MKLFINFKHIKTETSGFFIDYFLKETKFFKKKKKCRTKAYGKILQRLGKVKKLNNFYKTVFHTEKQISKLKN